MKNNDILAFEIKELFFRFDANINDSKLLIGQVDKFIIIGCVTEKLALEGRIGHLISKLHIHFGNIIKPLTMIINIRTIYEKLLLMI